MDEQQQKTMRWILFLIILLLFLVISILTIYEVFIRDINHLMEDERELLFNTFLVSIGTSIIALFYSIFGLKHSGGESKEIGSDREFIIRLNFEDLRDIKSFFGLEVVCTPIAEHSETLAEISCYIIDDGGPCITIKPPKASKFALISFDKNGISYSGSFALGSFLVDMIGDEL